MHGARLKYLRNGLNMLKMTSEFDNGLDMWEMTNVCGKWLKFLRNG